MSWNTTHANSPAVEQVPANTASIPGIYWIGGEKLQEKTSNTNMLFPICHSRNTETSKQKIQVKVHTMSPHLATSLTTFTKRFLPALCNKSTSRVKNLWLFKVTEQNWLLLNSSTNFHMLNSKCIQLAPCNCSLCYPEMLIESAVLTVLNFWYSAGGYLCVQSLHSLMQRVVCRLLLQVLPPPADQWYPKSSLPSVNETKHSSSRATTCEMAT